MVSPYFEDFLGDAFREAIQIRAYLCLSDRQADPYETDANDGQITAGHLVWNHFVALHNSNRALRHCAAGLSEESEVDTLIFSALTHVAHLLDFLEGKLPVSSIASMGMDEFLETAVRTQAVLGPNPPKGCVGAGYAREEKRG